MGKLSESLSKSYDEMMAFYDELNGESARAAAILAASGLDDELEKLLLKKFPDTLDKKFWKKQICGPGFTPLGSFKAKADLAQAFGYYGKVTRTRLEKISNVRNRFAHSSKPRSFLDDDILRFCRDLGFTFPPSRSPTEKDVRWFYIGFVRSTHESLARVRSHIPELDPQIDPLP